MSATRLGVAVLTMGNRPAELAALLASVAAQDTLPERTVVIANGVPLPDLPDHVTGIELPKNLGVSGGRNAAIAHLRAAGDIDVVVDLDDDGLLPHTDTLRQVRALYDHQPGLGVVGFRIADENGETQRRHIPRLRTDDPMRGGPVTTFLGGGHALSMRMLDEVGDWPDDFFFTHEETDLAWRALDAGWDVVYAPHLLLQHPRTSPARHAVYHRMTARNRVWLARRNLPAPLVPAYLGTWTILTAARSHRDPRGLKAWAGGFREGWTSPAGERRPMRWRTVWKMTRLGRPPIV